MNLIACLLLIMTLIQASYSVAHIIEEGLCAIVPTECSSRLQRKGICCKKPKDNSLIYFRNSCLACLYVFL